MLIYFLRIAFLSIVKNHTVFLFSHVSLWDAERNQDSMKQSSAMQPREDQDNQKLAANSHFQHVISEQWEP